MQYVSVVMGTMIEKVIGFVSIITVGEHWETLPNVVNIVC